MTQGESRGPPRVSRRSLQSDGKLTAQNDTLPEIMREMDEFLAAVQAAVQRDSPHLLDLFRTFAQEARFARLWIADDLRRLAVDAKVLEVGAGSMLLSCQLRREGIAVTALEPIGEGFGAFAELQRLVLQHAAREDAAPEVLALPAEDLTASDEYAFAFSLNVMEHVIDYGATLGNIARALRPGGRFRFACANYVFPYEPHFNIPILFSKQLTERLFRKRIFQHPSVSDPEGVWSSLNWITVPKVRKALSGMPDISLDFNTRMFETLLERVLEDEEFARRRSPLICGVIRALVRSKLHRLTRWIPATIQPMMDCALVRLE